MPSGETPEGNNPWQDRDGLPDMGGHFGSHQAFAEAARQVTVAQCEDSIRQAVYWALHDPEQTAADRHQIMEEIGAYALRQGLTLGEIQSLQIQAEEEI